MNLKKLFSFEAVDDFDKHISMSIPDYKGLCEIFKIISVENVNPKGLFIDCGCSSGKFISELPKIKTARYIGCDLVDIRVDSDFDFILADTVETLSNIDRADVVCVMFTMQFMGKHSRREMVKELKRLNDSGAVILIAEKVFLGSPKLNQVLSREHLRKKRGSFSDSEILDKDYDLIGSMFCLTSSEIEDELSVFDNVDQVWQSYNFKAWCIS
jgi:SAM-dependent methyltransferase